MFKKTLIVLAIFAAMSTKISFAQNFAGNIGVLETVGIPDGTHLGVYLFSTASLVIPVNDKVSLIPNLGAEWAPEFDRWGFIGILVADYTISQRVGLDLNLIFVHDQFKGKWNEALYFFGFGPGFSIFLDKWTISPSVNFYRGLNVSGWCVDPTINISYVLF